MLNYPISVLLRNQTQNLIPVQILTSILNQPGIREMIVLDLQPALQQISVLDAESSSSFLQATDAKPYSVSITYANIPAHLSERAFLIGGQIAQNEICLLWDCARPMPDYLVEDLFHFYQDQRLVGLSGRRFDGTTSWISAPIYQAVSEVTPVDYLDPLGMMLHRKFLDLPDMRSADHYSQHIGMWVCAHAIFQGSASCAVVPTRLPLFANQAQQPGESTFSDEANNAEVDSAIAYLNHHRTFRSWEEINTVILPQRATGSHFARLSSLQKQHIVIFGCQRSGTTWFTRCVGEYFQHTAFKFNEIHTFHFLLDDYVLPHIDAEYLVWQATFLNTEVESYKSCPDNTKFLLLVRNPFSVCYSFLYSSFRWLGLAPLYQYRKTSMLPEDTVPALEGEFKMALEVYRQSMRTNLEILLRCHKRMRVIVYDDAVEHTAQTLAQTAHFLELDIPKGSTPPLADNTSLNKRYKLPQEQEELIRQYADPLYSKFLTTARALGVLNAV